MNEFRARIGRVRMKSGGADLRIIEGFAAPDAESMAATAMREVRECVNGVELAAFMLLGVSTEGRCHFGFRYLDGCPISRTLMPSYVEELARKALVTRKEACDVVNWANGFSD